MKTEGTDKWRWPLTIWPRLVVVMAKHPRRTRVSLFIVLVVVALPFSVLLSKASVISQLEQSTAVFGEGKVVASGPAWFPDSAPGETVYTNVTVNAEWLGDVRYRIVIRGSAPEYVWSHEPEDIRVSASPDNRSETYVVLAEDLETRGWVTLKDEIDWWYEIHKIYFRWEAGSPLPGGAYDFMYEVKMEPDIDMEAYAWEKAWGPLNLAPWLLSITAFLWVFLYAVIRLPQYLRD